MEALTPFFLKETTAHWCEKFDAVGVPAGPVMNHVEVLQDPQTLARNMVQEGNHPAVGPMKTLGIPVKLSDGDNRVHRPAPVLGEHGKEVIAEWLGADESARKAS